MENINDLIEYNINFIKNKPNFRIRRLELKNLDGNTLPTNDCISLHKILIEKSLIFESEHKDLFLTGMSEEIILNGGWLNHLRIEKDKIEKAESKEILEIANLKLQKESSEYSKTLRQKEEEIRNLTRDNLRLGNWDIRFRWYIAVTSFIIGFIIKYFIDK
ncbi:hypothetical protein [Flavobacterium sp. 245]|uniref:hypothetical protein n=1 Tax=Flavobacterium sp. 245 TaxID=2512115 RepID=UPI00105BC16D|nr:hypothetical protein [Flavobacterium sp. 245]TDP02460.1 hypothetical protein EV145_103450 [Flavobacterium sp. 245]